MTRVREINGSQVSLFSEVPDDLDIGVGSRIWSFSVVESRVKIGNGVVVGAHCFIGAGTKIGDFTRIQDGAFIPRGTIIEDHVFIGPQVVMTDDKYPMAGNPRYDAQPPRIKSFASIGANATIMPGITIGPGASVGAGSVVTRDVEAADLVMGIPARSKQYAKVPKADEGQGRKEGQGQAVLIHDEAVPTL